MTEKDWQDIITLVRRAPLQNSDESDAVRVLLNKLKSHIDKQLEAVSEG